MRERDEDRSGAPRWRYPWLAFAFAFVAISGVGLIAAGDRSGIFYTILGLVGIGQAWVIGHPDRSKPPALFVAKFGVPLTLLAFVTTFVIVRAVGTHEHSGRPVLFLLAAVNAVLFALIARQAMRTARAAKEDHP